jgi:teichuronic acid biosynthesis glycosyltransferase TuaG
MLSPKVSVIMPAFNAGNTIKDAIDSVKKQSFDEWELIIIDDGSTDDTSVIAQGCITPDPRVKLLKLERNGGLPNARNQGCMMAKGEYIAFLDSDDLWHKDKLKKQIQFHSDNPEIEISHTNFIAFDSSKFYARPFRKFLDSNEKVRGDIYPGICYKNSIGVLTVMVKRELLIHVNLFDPSLWTMEDQDLWIRIAKEKKEFGYLTEALAYYRISEGGISKKTGKYKRAYKKFFRKILHENNLNERLLFRYYYRHFGTVYFKKENYKLSTLYFIKSLKLLSFDRQALSTYMYVLYGLIKWSLKSTLSRG